LIEKAMNEELARLKDPAAAAAPASAAAAPTNPPRPVVAAEDHDQVDEGLEEDDNPPTDGRTAPAGLGAQPTRGRQELAGP
jgi:ribosomal protein L12E/L44/L45/RPP1/RPP2